MSRVGVEGLDDVRVGVKRQAYELGQCEDGVVLRLIFVLLEGAQAKQVLDGRDADPTRVFIAVGPRSRP